MRSIFLTVLLAFSLGGALVQSCSNPKIESTFFTTQDATIVSQIAFVSEFSIKCSDTFKDKSLFAELEGQLITAARIGADKYQISWIEEVKKVRTGDYNIRIFDEEGFAAVRKAQRSGEDLQNIKSLAEIVVSHPGSYKGPWVNSELMAASVVAMVAYFAFTTRGKLLS